jgi:hypothetical protein
MFAGIRVVRPFFEVLEGFNKHLPEGVRVHIISLSMSKKNALSIILHTERTRSNGTIVVS